MEVADNGDLGTSPLPFVLRLGLRNLTERIALLGGSIGFAARDGGGLAAKVSLPLETGIRYAG